MRPDGTLSTPGRFWRLARSRVRDFGAIAVVLVVAGCSSSAATTAPTTAATTAPTTAPTTASSAPVKIVVWEFFNGPDTPSTTQIISNFNSSQSQVEVIDTPMNFDSLTQKLPVAIASGTGPDLVTLGTDFVSQYVAKGVLAPFDDFYATDAAKSLLPQSYGGATIGGHTYGMPVNFYDEMLCYNKDIFNAAGLTPPTTWDEFATDAPKLTKTANGKVVQYPIALGNQTDTTRFWQPLLWNGGGGVVSDDGKTALLSDPKTLSALQFWVNGVKDNHWSPIGDDGPQAEALFNAGKAAMVPCGPWVVGTAQAAKINLGLAPMPSGPAGNFPWSQSTVWAAPSTISADHKAAAEQFAAFWNSKASQIIFSGANGYPSTRTDLTASDTPNNPYVGIFGAPNIIGNAKLYLAGVANGSQIDQQIFIPTLQKALAGQGTVQDLFTAANAQVQALLKP